MKKNLLQALSVFCGSMLLAQPTLNSSGINPVSGETMTLKTGGYASPGSSGASQTWNVSAIALTSGSTTNYTVGAVSATPYSSTFSGSSNIQLNDGSVYQFMNNSASVMASTGVVGNGVTIPYSNAEDILHFPFNMNDNYTDNWAATFTSNSITFNRTGTTTVTYDAYGTLTTPAGTFSNVVRVHMVQDYKDVSSFGTITYNNNEYIWYANGYHQALAAVYTLTNSIGGPPTQSGIYLSTTPGVPTSISKWSEVNSNISLYPNPATDLVGISSDEGIDHVDVYDLKGDLVLSEKVMSIQAYLKLGELNNGIYLAKINMANGDVRTKKITLNK
jgi:hypothetical protein